MPAEVGERVHSSVPVLFLNGNEDSADPPANVANARRELPNSRTVIFAAAGHGQLGLPCAQSSIADFVERASTRGLATACAHRRPPGIRHGPLRSSGDWAAWKLLELPEDA